LTKSWVSGGRSGELIERLRTEISELEAERDEFVEKNKRVVFDWTSFALSSKSKQKDPDFLWNHTATLEIREVIMNYESINQTILGKQALLNEKLNEQAKLDSLA
jgi:predicted secreted protein